MASLIPQLAQMRFRSFIARCAPAMALFFASNALEAQPRIAQAIVISEVSIGSPQPTSALSALLPSMVVDVYARTDQALLVRRQFDRSAKGWIKADAVIDPSAFTAVVKWTGRKQHEVYSDSADSGRTYFLRADGSFRSRDSTSSGDTWDEGRLYRYGDVVWARSKRTKSGELDPWAFFHVVGQGSLCTYSDEGYCPENSATAGGKARNGEAERSADPRPR